LEIFGAFSQIGAFKENQAENNWNVILPEQVPGIS